MEIHCYHFCQFHAGNALFLNLKTKHFPHSIHHFSHFVRAHEPAPTTAPASRAHEPDMTSSSFDLTVESMNLMLRNV
ncbi:hypothetical protein T4C_4495 [Trichinella pseudospiralis]|uniref:Uncharacterized protein n=1 Tax=Trichinella pseudospiralis TaxID=6337 RepID=A0A0V1K1D9_TRIPS|nr:hypothetical protein T4C_4495 [Trichinella pseudospiralis]